MTEKAVTSIHDFEKQAASGQAAVDERNALLLKIEQTNNELIKLVPELNERQVGALLAALHTAGKFKSEEKLSEGEGFNVAHEVSMLLATVKALREQVILNGAIKQGVSITEAQRVATTCTAMINTLMKHEQELQNMERHRSIEGAVVDTLKFVEENNPEANGITDKFLTELERRLEAVR